MKPTTTPNKSLQVSAGWRASQLALSGVGRVPPPAPPELRRWAAPKYADMSIVNFPNDHPYWFVLLGLVALACSVFQAYAGYHYGLFIYEQAFKENGGLYISRDEIHGRGWKENVKYHKWRKRVLAYGLHKAVFYFSCSFFGFVSLYVAAGILFDVKDWSQTTPGTATILTALCVISVAGVSGALARILFLGKRVP